MHLVYHAPALPRPAETAMGHDFWQIPGGKGANQAVAAGRLRADESVVDRVGDDEFGVTLASGLAA